MGPSFLQSSSDPERAVREFLLTGLHLGRLREGSRVPSVRSLGRVLGLNPKTVHRAYLRLAAEGMLELRGGSGTFLRSDLSGKVQLDGRALAETAKECRQIAGKLGLSPRQLARFLGYLEGECLGGRGLAFVECNGEQLQLIARELEALLDLPLEPVLLGALRRRGPSMLAGCRGVVTTDCHRSEVAELVQETNLPVYRVALTASFPRALVDAARGGRLLMVVADRRFGPIFDRLLENLGVSEELRGRIRVVERSEAPRLLASLENEASVYVSKTVERDVPLRGALRLRRVDPGAYVERHSAEELAAKVALDRALAADAEGAARVRGLLG